MGYFIFHGLFCVCAQGHRHTWSVTHNVSCAHIHTDTDTMLHTQKYTQGIKHNTTHTHNFLHSMVHTSHTHTQNVHIHAVPSPKNETPWSIPLCIHACQCVLCLARATNSHTVSHTPLIHTHIIIGYCLTRTLSHTRY